MNKQLMAVFWKAVQHKPIWVFFAAAVISMPCAAEAPAVNRAKVSPELVSSGKVPWKDLKQDGMEHMTSVSQLTVKAIENSRVNSGAKNGRGGSKTSATLSPERKTMHGDIAKQDNDGAYECGDYCGFYGWLPFLLAWPKLFGVKKPNV